MARFRTTISSPLAADVAFAKLAAFERAPEWDPNTTAGTRVGSELAVGTGFDITTVFGGRSLELRYTMTAYEPHSRYVVEADMPNGTHLRDEIVFVPRESGCDVTYDALIRTRGIWKLADPLFQVIFRRIGRSVVGPLSTFLATP
jgi:hypothetical protein